LREPPLAVAAVGHDTATLTAFSGKQASDRRPTGPLCQSIRHPVSLRLSA